MEPRKISTAILKGLGLVLKFILLVFVEILDTKAKKQEPATQEIMCGEKIPFSDKYFIPDEKYHNK